jgi:hypothetical protein
LSFGQTGGRQKKESQHEHEQKDIGIGFHGNLFGFSRGLQFARARMNSR